MSRVIVFVMVMEDGQHCMRSREEGVQQRSRERVLPFSLYF